MKEYTDNGVAYTYDICSSEGASFILYPNSNHSKADVKIAKAWLRRQHDVVSLSIASDEDRDQDYRAAIFRESLTKPMPWYQINADDMKVIRKERLAGTSPLEFVLKHVVGQEKDTEAKNLIRRGQKMYDL